MLPTRTIGKNLKTLRGAFAGLAASALAVGLALPAAAEDWPSRPITIIIGTAAGGSPDTAARLIAQKLTERTGWSVIVENSPGAQGVAANVKALRAAPDGHTMVMFTGGTSGQAAIRKSLPYDLSKDFEMVTLVAAYPMVISVRPESPITSVADMIARAKADPGGVRHTMTSIGSLYHLLGAWISLEAGIDMPGVSYRGSPPAFTDVAAGRIEVMLDAPTFSFAQIKAGKLRPLAITSSKEYRLLPGVPTLNQTLPGVEMVSWLGLAAPTGTPRPIVDRLNKEIRAVLELPDVERRFNNLGNMTNPSTPEEMRAHIVGEIKRWKRVAEAKGIEAK